MNSFFSLLVSITVFLSSTSCGENPGKKQNGKTSKEGEYIEVPTFSSWEEERDFFAAVSMSDLLFNIEARCQAERSEAYHFQAAGFFGEGARRMADDWDDNLMNAILDCLAFPLQDEDIFTFVGSLEFIVKIHTDKFKKSINNRFTKEEVKELMQAIEDYSGIEY
jgi:hypothetical protein